MEDPANPGTWLGYYEGGMPADAHEEWSMGLATAPSPLGPWAKHPANPILNGSETCDRARQFNQVRHTVYTVCTVYGVRYTVGCLSYGASLMVRACTCRIATGRRAI